MSSHFGGNFCGTAEQAEPRRPTSGRAFEGGVKSWKEIAAYLRRDVRTVIRWEKTEGLPVLRRRHHVRSSVFAYPGEVEAWKARRELPPDAGPRLTGVPRTAGAAGLALALLVALGMAGDDVGGVAGHEEAPEIRTDGPRRIGEDAAVHPGHDHVADQQVDWPAFYTFFDDARLAAGRALRHALGTTPTEHAET